MWLPTAFIPLIGLTWQKGPETHPVLVQAPSNLKSGVRRRSMAVRRHLNKALETPRSESVHTRGPSLKQRGSLAICKANQLWAHSSSPDPAPRTGMPFVRGTMRVNATTRCSRCGSTKPTVKVAPMETQERTVNDAAQAQAVKIHPPNRRSRFRAGRKLYVAIKTSVTKLSRELTSLTSVKHQGKSSESESPCFADCGPDPRKGAVFFTVIITRSKGRCPRTRWRNRKEHGNSGQKIVIQCVSRAVERKRQWSLYRIIGKRLGVGQKTRIYHQETPEMTQRESGIPPP
ncbi:hypothetical protein B0H14DRAFT_3725446 [Mycena olivaceomarginata]|nr:hypothetical protein B0H14DRAFT_3725446 [Mycena olivaceomarginata]